MYPAATSAAIDAVSVVGTKGSSVCEAHDVTATCAMSGSLSYRAARSAWKVRHAAMYSVVQYLPTVRGHGPAVQPPGLRMTFTGPPSIAFAHAGALAP